MPYEFLFHTHLENVKAEGQTARQQLTSANLRLVVSIAKKYKGRGMDLLSPVWNYLDLTPDGHGDWFPGS